MTKHSHFTVAILLILSACSGEDGPDDRKDRNVTSGPATSGTVVVVPSSVGKRIGPRTAVSIVDGEAPRFEAMSDALSSVPVSRRSDVLRMVSCASAGMDAQEVLKRRPALIRSIASEMGAKGFRSPCRG